MNEAHYQFTVDGQMKSQWAREWSDIKAQYPTAVLVSARS